MHFPRPQVVHSPCMDEGGIYLTSEGNSQNSLSQPGRLEEGHFMTLTGMCVLNWVKQTFISEGTEIIPKT